jgi:preprotein translocase subunit SecD
VSVGTRILALAAATVAAIVLIAPTFVSSPAWWPWQRPVRLGLDLRGGTHLLYEVQIEEAINNSVDRTGREVESELRDGHLPAATVRRMGRTVQVVLADRSQRADARRLIEQHFSNLNVTDAPAVDGVDIVIELQPREIARLKSTAVEQALAIVDDRIDEFGVVEPTLQKPPRS